MQLIAHMSQSKPVLTAPTDFSRYQRYAIIVQAVADGKKRFLDLATGFPGSLHDAHVLQNSHLNRRCENQELLTGPTMIVVGQEIGPYLVADMVNTASDSPEGFRVNVKTG